MKIVQINATSGVGSTGRICEDISNLLNQENIENYIFYNSFRSCYTNSIKFSCNILNKIQAVISRIFGNYGFDAKLVTRKMIMKLEEINPDIIHLHNIHGHNCNYEMIFKYAKDNKKKIIWTFHDCWAFTGYCPHFMISECNKWQSECSNCSVWKEYSWFLDKSGRNFQRKKKSIQDVNITVVTPSMWMKSMIEKSFFQKSRCDVIHNGIDLSVFRPQKSNIRNELGIKDECVLLFVSFKWDYSKGIDVVIDLAKKIDNNYKIVVIGTDESIEAQLPSNVITKRRTENQKELAKYYSMADLFVNPTRQDTFPTVNMEAIACGTPVVSFNTGGSGEIIGGLGSVTKVNTSQELYKEIEKNKFAKLELSDDCVEYAASFDKNRCFLKYLELYKEIQIC